MARNPRIIADDSFHHVIQRGNNKRTVFEQGRDYIKFKQLIRRYISQYRCGVVHYCLLSNHLHLLLHVEKGPDMPKFLQGLNLAYTLYYKKRYNFTGSLWQGRYTSFLIESDNYLMECARYIERNPVRAGLVHEPSLYPYSSYHHYAKGKKEDIVTENIAYKEFGSTTETRQQNYQAYISQDRLYEKLIDRALEICPHRT
jgi:putative transposase